MAIDTSVSNTSSNPDLDDEEEDDDTLQAKLRKQQPISGPSTNGTEQPDNTPQPDLDNPSDDQEDVGAPTPAPAPSAPASAGPGNIPHVPSGEVTDPDTLAGNLKGSRYYLGEYEKLANDPKYASQLPPDTRADLKNAIAEAREMYNQKTNVNDWVEVAQTLSRAMAQYGAARAGMDQSGKYGRDLSGINFGPGIDTEARNRRALDEYKQGVGQAQDLAGADRQNFLDSQNAREKEFGNKAGYLKEAINASTAGERTGEQERAANLRYGMSQARADAREKANSDRMDSHDRQMQYRDLDSQEKSLTKQLQAGQSLANEMQSEGDLSSKDAEKLKTKYGQQAAAAGVDLPSAVSQYQQNAPKRNRQVLGVGIPGTETTDEASPKNKQSLYDALGLTEKLKQLEDIKRQKSSLLNNSRSSNPAPGDTGGAQTASAPSTSTPAGPKQDPQIQQYADKYKLDYDHARDIMIKRGYKPQD